MSSVCCNHDPVLSSFMTYQGCVTRVTWQLPHVEKEMLIRRNHPRSPPLFSWVRVARSLILCAVFWSVILCAMFWGSLFVRPLQCLSCPSIYGFWLPFLISSACFLWLIPNVRRNIITVTNVLFIYRVWPYISNRRELIIFLSMSWLILLSNK